jgi:hypothetical protein
VKGIRLTRLQLGCCLCAACALCTDSRPPANLKLNPDTFRFQLDANNALQRTTLDVLANDAGEGLRITSFQTSDTYVGVLSLDRSNNRFTYGLAELTGGSRTWWFDYTVADSSGNTATARATVRVGEFRSLSCASHWQCCMCLLQKCGMRL